jgi:hypothetical protein
MSESPSLSVPNGRRHEVVGTRPIRHDGVEKATGQAYYGADVRLLCYMARSCAVCSTPIPVPEPDTVSLHATAWLTDGMCPASLAQ